MIANILMVLLEAMTLGLVSFTLLLLARWLYGALRRARRTRSARDELGEPPAELNEVADGQEVVLDGKLGSAGEAVARFDDGKPVAIAWATVAGGAAWFEHDPVAVGASRQATDLWLELDDGAKIQLDGPTALLSGTRERFSGWRAADVPKPVHQRLGDQASILDSFVAGFVVFSSLSSGDRVRVKGRLERSSTDQSGDYRHASSLTLRPQTDRGDIVLAARTAPRVSAPLRTLVSKPLLLLVSAVFLVFGGFGVQRAVAKQKRCDRSGNCKGSGRCIAKLSWTLESECVATTPDHCKKSTACKNWGQCTLSPEGECIISGAEDCRGTHPCKNQGLCTVKNGECVAGTDADCMASKGCKDFRQCLVYQDQCVTHGGPEDCMASRVCPVDGQCTFKDGQCTVGSDADCRRDRDCRDDGECTFKDGHCVAGTTQDCRNSYWCKAYGRCSLGPRGRCILASDADCIRSDQCASEGECKKKNPEKKGDLPKCGGRWKTTPCSQTAACSYWGRCGTSSSGYYCRARSHADCQQAEVCEKHGRCRQLDGACRKSCEEDEICRNQGRCTEKNGHCIASSDEQCQRSKRCQEQGMCHFAEKSSYSLRPRCYRTSDEWCRKSRTCLENANCSADDEQRRCRLRSSQDCQHSVQCTLLGKCTYDDKRCIAETDADCRDSFVCKRRGKCRADAKKKECVWSGGQL